MITGFWTEEHNSYGRASLMFGWLISTLVQLKLTLQIIHWAVSPKLSSVDFTVVKINWFTGPPAGHFMSPNLERTRSSHPIKWGNLIKQSDEQICIHFLEPQSHVAAALLYFKSVWGFFGLRDSLPFQNQISQPTAKTTLHLPVMSKRIEIFFLGMHRNRVRP